jgi:xanthine/CO dehydrogenase XdhC/CoxF family maturation factor
LSQDSFPGADLIQSHPITYHEKLNLGGSTSVVIMNHHYERDCHALRFALESQASYVGVLGPGHRFEKLLGELEAEEFIPTREQLDRVHNPIGLGIGAEGPEEIAVSIVGEVLACLRGEKGRMLRDSAG